MPSGNRYSVCVGIDTYAPDAKLPTLFYAEQDARDMDAALAKLDFPSDNRTLLLGPDATLTAINAALNQRILDKPGQDDLVIFYFCGHGEPLTIDKSSEVFLTPYDFNQSTIQNIPSFRTQQSLGMARLRTEFFERLEGAGQRLFVFDCCFSGDFSSNRYQRVQNFIRNAFNTGLGGRVFLGSCLPYQTAAESVRDKHGLFTHHLLQALNAQDLSAVTSEGRLTVNSFFDYVARKMPPEQIPVQSGLQFGGIELARFPVPVPDMTRAVREAQILKYQDDVEDICAANDQRDFVEDRVQRFVGRADVLDTIQRSIASKLETGGYEILTGDAGEGKTSIIAKLVYQQGVDTSIYHFIQYTSSHEQRVDLLRKLLANLIRKHNLPARYIASDSYPRLRDSFVNALKDISAAGKQEIIYIDGLDQLDMNAPSNPDLSFIPPRPIPGIVLVLGTRPNTTLFELRKFLPSENYHPYSVGKFALADFALLLSERGVPPLSPPLATRFYQAMDGNVLYLDLLAQELKANTTLLPAALIEAVESNPDKIFTLTFSRLKQSPQWGNVVRPLLATLFVAQEALTQQQIARICTVESYQVKDAITLLGGLLTRLGDEKYTLFHRKLYDYLKEKPAKEYEFELEEEQCWHRKLAKWCGQGTNEQLWANVTSPPRDDYREYARRHYITHLHYGKEYSRLFEVLDDGAYERSKLRADLSTRSTVLDLQLGCRDAVYADDLPGPEASLPSRLETLPRLWRYTLLRCSLATRADAYPPEAFQALLSLGRVREALDLVELLTRPIPRLFSLTLIAQQLLQSADSREEGRQVADRAYEVADAITDNNERVKAFAQLAASLQLADEQARAEACWQKARVAAAALPAGDKQYQAFGNLTTAFIQAHLWTQAEATVDLITNPIKRLELWGHLALSLRQANLPAQADAAWQSMQALVNGSTESSVQDKLKSVTALKLAQDKIWDEAKKRAEEINDGPEREAALVHVAADFIKASLWERGWRIINDIVQRCVRQGRTLSHFDNIFVDLSIALARAAQWEQAREIALVIPAKEPRSRALMGIVSELARQGLSWEAQAGWEEARALCTAQIDTVEARVKGIIASALVQAQQVAQAKSILAGISDDNIHASVLTTLVIALADTGEIQAAQTLAADKAIPPLLKWQIQSHLSLALKRAGQGEQAREMARSIENKNLRSQALKDLTMACCQLQQWEDAQAAAALIDDPTLQSEARRLIISELVENGEVPQAEALVNSVSKGYYKNRATCDLAIAYARRRNINIRLVNKLSKDIGQRNEGLQKVALCNLLVYTGQLLIAANTAKMMSRGAERDEALRDVAEYYATKTTSIPKPQALSTAQEIAAMIDDDKKRNEVRTTLAIAFAKDQQWDRALAILDMIPQKSALRAQIIQSWGILLAQAYNQEQSQDIGRQLNDGKEKASLLVTLANTLGQARNYSEQIRLLQQAWLKANTSDDCMYLFSIVKGLLRQSPEICIEFGKSFEWLNVFS